MRKIIAFSLMFCAAIGFGEVKPWASPVEIDKQAGELEEFLRGSEVRYAGSTGNLAMEEKIGALFAASGLAHGEIKFRAACFVPGEAWLNVSNQPSIRIYPLHPTMFRPGNFKEKEFTASLVYLGKGTNEDLERVKGKRLEGALALMEFNCGREWMRLLRFGVKGFIFLEPGQYEYEDAQQKIYRTEVRVPRYLARSAEGGTLRALAAQGSEVRIKAEPSRWANKFLRDFWVLIPGADADLRNEVAVVGAAIDSDCIVPELAYGAENGANLFYLTKLLADFKHQPPARSVLLVALNGHEFERQGERMLAWHMLAEEEEKEKLRDTLNDDIRAERALVNHYRKLKLAGYSKADEELLISWRSLVDETTGKNITVKNAVVALAKRDINSLKNQQVVLYQEKRPKEEKERRKKELEREIEKHVKVLTLFNKVGIRTKLSDLSAEEIRILKSYVQEVIQFNRVCAELNEKDLVLERENDAIREALKGDKIAFMIVLGLDWTSPQIGFAISTSDARWSMRWGANTHALGEEMAEKSGGKANLLADTLTMRGGFREDYYFLREQSQSRSAHTFLRTYHAAFDLQNVFPSGRKYYLPSDTFAGLNRTNFANETSFLAPYLRVLCNTPNITYSSELDMNRFDSWYRYRPMTAVQIKTFKFDKLSASVVPELPVPNTAVLLAGMMLTDERAATVFYGTHLEKARGKNRRAIAAFHYDKDFIEVDHVIDAGEVQEKLSSDDLYSGLILTLFEGREFPIYTRADSSLISGSSITVKKMIPLTAKGNSSPRKYGLSGISSVFSQKAVGVWGDAPAAMFFERDERIKLLTDKNRPAINATEKEYEGRGYGSADELGADFFRNVVFDLAVLNKARIRKFKDVADELVREFASRGDRCVAEMKKALGERDYLKYLRKQYEGLGAHTKSYEQTKQTSDDMLKAIVVYMALLLPFCFFIQKLVFNFVKIEHEMGAFAVLFIGTYIIFREIHPAFRVAQAPEAIFIAFVMGALGLFVISILRGRFEGEMQLLFRSYLSGIMDEAAYSTVTQKAMLIGVNNMKRRRIRTLLTTMTIVLVAFAMLSFTSISKKVNPTIIPKGRVPPYTGFMFHFPSKYTMEEDIFYVLRDIFSAHGEVLARRWKVSDMQFHVGVSNGRETSLDAILGLTAGEDGFLGKFPITAGRYFSADDAHEALISSQMAENLGVEPEKLEGVFINCQGYELRVVGLYDDDRIRNLKDLNGLPILPIKEISQLMVGNIGGERQVEKEQKELDEIEEMGLLTFVDPLSLLIVPCDTLRRMGGNVYSVSVKMKEEADVWPLLDTMLTATKAKFYLGSLQPFRLGSEGQKAIAGGTYYVGSNYKTSVGGLAILLIPLFIASTIILNTMLGSVYERKKEIAVYNAIGLNPHHIGLFFLAESFVYGVIGSVGGYLIGQVLSLGINYSGVVKGINFNYSSLSVAYVIMFTIGVVLLSTIYPAFAAVRTAVPSGKRTWSMPQPKGNLMEVVFPFIFQPKIACGVLAYLQEYFARFTDASIGDLIAAPLGRGCAQDEKGRERFKLEYNVALAPYDLGVTEDLKFNLAFDEYVQAYSLILRIERVSGQDINWVTTNRPFLEHLRKYLMRWRNLDLGQQMLYVQQAGDLLRRS